MKKIILLLTVIVLSITLLSSCDILNGVIGELGGLEGNGYIDGDSEEDQNSDDGNSGDNSTDGEKDEPLEENKYSYTAFTPNEKALLGEIAGGVIPFIPNDEYYVEEYFDEYYYESCVNFYTYGNTQTEFNAYKALFSDYELIKTYEDDYGDTWYCFNGETYVEMCYYYYEGEYVVDVYVYVAIDDGESSGGKGDGNGESGGNESTESNLITNASAGLPSGTNGVYNIDFTDATRVKNVTEQGNYLDGCPTVGSPKVLVIPIDFIDINGRNNAYYSIDNIKRAFSGITGETDYYSVDEYYYISSYGKLDLDITVVNEWFVPKYESSYYATATMDYYGEEVSIGDQLVMDEALEYLSASMNLSQFDSDGNAIIDAVVLVTTLEIDDTTDFYWAYRYWNIYTDDEGYYYEYDGVCANDYLWASYSFIHESYDEDGYADYTDTSVINTYTYIHEFGHILGLDDYYNTADTGEHPMDGCDVMDGLNGDHNPFSKFNLGWLTTSRLVTADTSVTLTLDAFSKAGDSIIIASNWDVTLGAYQEYYVLVFYSNEGLNSGEGGYFSRDGVIVYHVNASLCYEEYDGEIYYDIYNNNTDPSDGYGTADNLIEFVKSSEGNFTYVEGDSLPTVNDDQGSTLPYTFTVDSIEDGVATLTFTKN